jgi:hypothetical protein
MRTALLFIGGFVILAIGSWLGHLRRLRRHTGQKRSEFTTEFSTAGFSSAVAGAVYDHFKRMGVWKNFCPAPSDTLEQTYQTVDEDVDDNLEEILKQLGYEMPNSAILREWERPVETLSDVVEWLDWAVKKQASPEEHHGKGETVPNL